MNLNRKFQHQSEDRLIDFDVTYSPETHLFRIHESGKSEGYDLRFDTQTRTWSTMNGPDPSISPDELAQLVQQAYGHYV